MVVCEETDLEGAELLAERIRAELSRATFVSPHAAVKVTCSVGVAAFPEAGSDWDSLFKATDEALYTSGVARSGGRTEGEEGVKAKYKCRDLSKIEMSGTCL